MKRVFKSIVWQQTSRDRWYRCNRSGTCYFIVTQLSGQGAFVLDNPFTRFSVIVGTYWVVGVNRCRRTGFLWLIRSRDLPSIVVVR